MTTEEKAKAYDEALKQAKFYHGNCPSEPERKKLEKMFPVLHESEDERMLREIKRYLKEQGDKPTGLPNGTVTVSDMIAWLEKQKEVGIRWFESDNIKNPEKPYIDKVGMFYTTDGRMCHASDIEKQKDILSERATNITVNMLEDGIEGIQRELIEFLSNTINAPWIDVIKSADAYAQRIKSMIEKQKDSDMEFHEGYTLGFSDGVKSVEQKEPHYTKRNALFDKCVENCDPAVMKSVSDEVDEMLEKEQKPAEWSEDWREEDIQTRFAFYTYKDDSSELYLSNVFVEEASRNHGFGTKILRAAEKVAETIGATTICLKVKQDSPANAWYRKNGYGYVAFEDGYDWLEKNLEYMKPNKQEWNDEDEARIERIAAFMWRNRKGDTDDIFLQEQDVAWLKSLRPCWKPSEEQMEVLAWCKPLFCDPTSKKILESLINDLNKLM